MLALAEPPCNCKNTGECTCWTSRHPTKSNQYSQQVAPNKQPIASSSTQHRPPSVRSQTSLDAQNAATTSAQHSPVGDYATPTYPPFAGSLMGPGRQYAPSVTTVSADDTDMYASPTASSYFGGSFHGSFNQSSTTSITSPSLDNLMATSFSFCDCGDGCTCPGCAQHRGQNNAIPPGPFAARSCMNPSACGACVDCTLASMTSGGQYVGQSSHSNSDPSINRQDQSMFDIPAWNMPGGRNSADMRARGMQSLSMPPTPYDPTGLRTDPSAQVFHYSDPSLIGPDGCIVGQCPHGAEGMTDGMQRGSFDCPPPFALPHNGMDVDAQSVASSYFSLPNSVNQYAAGGTNQQFLPPPIQSSSPTASQYSLHQQMQPDGGYTMYGYGFDASRYLAQPSGPRSSASSISSGHSSSTSASLPMSRNSVPPPQVGGPFDTIYEEHVAGGSRPHGSAEAAARSMSRSPPSSLNNPTRTRRRVSAAISKRFSFGSSSNSSSSSSQQRPIIAPPPLAPGSQFAMFMGTSKK